MRLPYLACFVTATKRSEETSPSPWQLECAKGLRDCGEAKSVTHFATIRGAWLTYCYRHSVTTAGILGHAQRHDWNRWENDAVRVA
jgi:hypothetical protein